MSLRFVGLAALLALSTCRSRPAPPPPLETAPKPVSQQPVAARSTPPRRVQVTRIPVAGDQPVFAVRGSRPGASAIGVFLHGHCGHGLGYLQAFQFAAAEAGHFIALQGDVRCGTGARRAWSGDVDALDRRIDQALRAYLGREPPEDIVLGGSSQGVLRAVALARRFPRKYRRLILSSTFRELPAAGLGSGHRAYFLVGEHEDQWPTQLTARRWRAAGVATAVQVVDRGGHSDFHGRGNALMREAFHFVSPAQGGNRPEAGVTPAASRR